jgi:hypothetical protein
MGLTRKKKINKKKTNKKILRGGSVNPRNFNKIYLGPQRGILQPQTYTNKINFLYKFNADDYEPFVKTNTHLAFEVYNDDLKANTYVYISPFELSVDTMQYAINKHSIYINKDINNNIYLGFNEKFPSLVVEKSFSHKDTRQSEGFFYNVYESTEYLKNTYNDNLHNYNINERFIANVMIKRENETKFKPKQIYQDINYVKNNSVWLEEFFKLNPDYNFNLIANEVKKSINKPTYKDSDLSNIDSKYIIIDNTITIDNEQYVICGYPDPKKMINKLSFWDDEEFLNIQDFHKLNLGNLLVEFYNIYNKIEFSKEEEKQNEYYKLYYKVRETDWNYIINYFTKKYETTNDKKYLDFKEKFIESFAKYYNDIGKQYFNKPITRIRYIFLIYKKQKKNQRDINESKFNNILYKFELIPAIFNIKDLEVKHKPILEKINKLIKHDIPRIFNIISMIDYNSLDTDINEHKLFYSYYKYGDFFHITTEYMHPMSNIVNYAHHYRNTITLEEIIYASSNENFYKNVRIDYLVRNNRVLLQSDKKNNRHNRNTNNISLIKNRSDKVFEEYKKYLELHKLNSNETHNLNVKLPLIDISSFIDKVNKPIIILMYEESYVEYTFIYKYKNDFYIIILKSNIANITDNIIEKIYNNNYNDKIYFNGDAYINLFNVLKCEKISETYYKNIFKYNPINLKHIVKIDNIASKIDLQDFYSSRLLTNKVEPFFVDNLFNQTIHYPLLIDNYFKRSIYKEKKLLDLNIFTPMLPNNYCHMKECLQKDMFINYIYYDENNCGYDFIELFDYSDKKIILWILPSNKDSNQQKYLGNFMDLDNTSLPMLKEIKSIYENNNNLCIIHTVLSIVYYCLHIHIISKKDLYIRKFPDIERGSYMIQDLYINEVINNILINSNYYNKSNYNLIKQ